jgi:hypothetical protein
MHVSGNLQYITQKEINKQKWDYCIDNADNGLIYSYSFYLDHMARHWDALILNDYEAVMPLTWNKKYGIHYLYQPPFVAATGVSGKNISETTVGSFIRAIPGKFRFMEISLNHGNSIAETTAGISIKNNYTLNLNKGYDEIYKNYRENIQRNIKKSQQAGCYCKTDIPVNDVINLNKEQMKRVANITDTDYENFKSFYEYLQPKHQAITYGIYSARHELLASCVYFFSHKRAYYILVGNHPNGKTLGASHHLIDCFIADNSNKDLLLDFEGSDIRNLAFFYSSFGATLETYPALRINRLPWWAKWLKE